MLDHNVVRYRFVVSISLLLIFLMGGTALADQVIREKMEDGVWATLRRKMLGLEVHPPAGNAARGMLEKYLADPKKWEKYKGIKSVHIPFGILNPLAQRKVLLAVFPRDYVTTEGWYHVVRGGGEVGRLEQVRGLVELVHEDLLETTVHGAGAPRVGDD